MPRSAERAPVAKELHSVDRASRRVASFDVFYTQFLDAEGQAHAQLPKFARDTARLVELYRHMVMTRLFDQRAVALQRTGRLGTYPSSLGQEAAEVGLGAAMARADVLLGTYRETGAMLVRGVEMHEILQYWGGDERGSDYAGQNAPREDFPICVPIATHAPQAVGVAYAFKLRGEPRAAVCSLGDGATSKGDFYEALNAAGVWQLPLVFVVVNNQWAISVSRDKQSRAQTLAQKAVAAGLGGEQVDGNDVIAVYHAVERALSRARAGEGPHLIEALTYRMSDHTTSDDARRYRPEAEVEAQRALDPIERLRKYLIREGAWDAAAEERLRAEHAAAIEAAVETYLATPVPPASAMFDHLFARLPSQLEAQRDSAMEYQADE
jgi:2-oxoisovalerate dehydrogenase E1 component subunit alpha